MIDTSVPVKAQVSVSITRSNGMNVNASAEVDDFLVVEIAAMLGAMLFDAATTPSALEGLGDGTLSS